MCGYRVVSGLMSLTYNTCRGWLACSFLFGALPKMGCLAFGSIVSVLHASGREAELIRLLARASKQLSLSMKPIPVFGLL